MTEPMHVVCSVHAVIIITIIIPHAVSVAFECDVIERLYCREYILCTQQMGSNASQTCTTLCNVNVHCIAQGEIEKRER